MATRAESAGLSFPGSEDDEDDIVFLHAETTSNHRAAANTIESLLHPRPRLMSRHIRSVTPAQRDSARRNERRRPTQMSNSPYPPPHHHFSHHSTNSLVLPGQPPPPPAAPAVIDLTEEPDSPVMTRPTLPLPRNPRRTGSQRASPPRLSRSDGSTFIAPSVTHIDLTDDSPEDERPQDHRRLRSQHSRNAFNRFPGTLPDELISFEIMNATAGLARGFGRHLAGLFGVDVVRSNFAQPQLNVSLNSFQSASNDGEGSKPPMEAVAPPRKDFTRDTCANPDEDSVESVVICPACNEELAYDPTGGASQGPAAVAGKKRKRAPGEHHFWALKKCGHVYCADCFENRKPTKASPEGVGFRLLSGETPLNAPNDIRCAVEDCETKVAQKTEWVGIFL